MSKGRVAAGEMPLLQRKRAVVIGASSGIGAALARRLAEEGFVVATLARRGEALRELCAEINAQMGEERALAYEHDVTQFESVPALFQKLLQELKRIDLVAYVAGVMPPVAPAEYDFGKDRAMIEVNLLGAMAWLGQAATLFERMGAGQIVGISSVAGDRGRVGNPAYHTSKAGLATYLESLRNRLTRHGVHVLTVKPGFVKTAMLENARASFGAVSPEKAAKAIWRAIRRRKQQIYVPGWWRWVMLVIQHTPSFIFRHLSF